MGLARRDSYYSARLRQLAHLDVDEAEAEKLWRSVARHRREMLRRLGRDVGQRVALLDYVVNIRPRLIEPQIIERSALEGIEHRAVVDSLSGLYNRRYFDSELVRETERCRRYGSLVSLVLLDLDQFKGINDCYGHRVGDQVIETVGGLILKHVRTADVPCRYGGDEFAIILPDTPKADAVVVADRIRADIASSFESHVAMVTASGGIATFDPNFLGADDLFREADRCLYEAKGAGGNRVVSTIGREASQPTLGDAGAGVERLRLLRHDVSPDGGPPSP